MQLYDELCELCRSFVVVVVWIDDCRGMACIVAKLH